MAGRPGEGPDVRAGDDGPDVWANSTVGFWGNSGLEFWVVEKNNFGARGWISWGKARKWWGGG